jgi:acetylglutamate kinase
MEDSCALNHLLLDVLFMETVGMQPVLVHGGGAAISQAMSAAGLEPRWVQGRRYTDEKTLEIVERVLAGQINDRLAAQIELLGGFARGLNFRTHNVLFGRRITLPGPDGEKLDLGFVGDVTRVDADEIRRLSSAGVIPIIPSMCIDSAGQKLNVNADTAATAVAQALQAEKLVFLSDVNGVRRDKKDPGSLIDSLTAAEARRLIASGAIESGMIPKVQACLETLQHGVRKIHIIDGRLRHSLLLEIYTSRGVGTEIIQEVKQ